MQKSEPSKPGLRGTDRRTVSILSFAVPKTSPDKSASVSRVHSEAVSVESVVVSPVQSKISPPKPKEASPEDRRIHEEVSGVSKSDDSEISPSKFIAQSQNQLHTRTSKTRLFQPGHLSEPPLPKLPCITSPEVPKSSLSSMFHTPTRAEPSREPTGEDYLPSPSQIDPEVLKELPADIRNQIETAMKKRKDKKEQNVNHARIQPITEEEVRAGCSHWPSPTLPSNNPNVIGPDHEQPPEISSDCSERTANDNIVPLPSPSQIPALETGGTLEMRADFSEEIESILATTKTKKSDRRKRRRLNSSGQLEGETPSSAESVNSSRQSASLKQPDPPRKATLIAPATPTGLRRSRRSGKQSEHVHSEPSQSVQVTWDDETASRLEQERLALELQRAHSPTQCTQPIGEEFRDNAQDSDTDDSLEVQINLKHGFEMKTGKTGQLRTPTPEPPTLGFPTAAANQTEAELIELIKEETEEKADVPPQDLPVFMVSGIQQQERDDYRALVKQLGGWMLEGRYYHASCTHLVVANPTLNEKLMACVASGKWVLHKSYFEACRQEGRFVEEEGHEWGTDGKRSILASCSDLTAELAVLAHRWRIDGHDNRKASKTCRGAFEDLNVALCTDKNKDEDFKPLLEAGGARVASIRKDRFSQKARLRASSTAAEQRRIIDYEEKRLQNEKKRQEQIQQRLLEARREAAVLEEEETTDDKEFPELTDEMEEAVSNALIGRPEEILSEGFKLQVRRLDMGTLAGLTWLNDVTIDFAKKTINYYDSMFGDNIQCVNTLWQYLNEESLDKRITPFDMSGWSTEIVKGIPKQENDSDCGMFTCKYAEYISRRAPITFTQEHMPYFRRRMVYEILTKQLL